MLVRSVTVALFQLPTSASATQYHQLMMSHLSNCSITWTQRTIKLRGKRQLFNRCHRTSLYVVVRSSVYGLSSVTFVRPTQLVEIFGNVSTPFGTWPSDDIHRKFYGDRPRETARGIAEYSDFGPMHPIDSIGPTVVPGC